MTSMPAPLGLDRPIPAALGFVPSTQEPVHLEVAFLVGVGRLLLAGGTPAHPNRRRVHTMLRGEVMGPSLPVYTTSSAIRRGPRRVVS